jgi:hypothetical protein
MGDNVEQLAGLGLESFLLGLANDLFLLVLIGRGRGLSCEGADRVVGNVTSLAADGDGS